MRTSNRHIRFRHQSGVLLYVFLFCVLFFAFACKKKSNIISVDPGLKALWEFQPGSYWIYKDSITSKIDSMYVVSNYTQILDNGYTNTEIDYVLMNIFDGNLNDSESWRITMTQNTCGMWIQNNDDGVSNLSSMYLYSYPLSTYNINDGTSNLFINILYQNIVINGIDYDSVVVIHHQSTQSSLIFNDSLYYSPSLCFVKYVKQHPQDSVFKTMELQRYHIVL